MAVGEAEKNMVFAARLTQRGHRIRGMDDLMELYEKTFTEETVEAISSLPHPAVQKFAVITVAVTGASRRFGSMWLSDFVDNYLGGPLETVHEGKNQEQEKPDCPLIGQNGNIYNLLGIAARTLGEHGRKEQAKEMTDRVFASGSYEEALCIIGEYVNITDSHEERLSICRQLRREDLPKKGKVTI